jgi:hypothetical protein
LRIIYEKTYFKFLENPIYCLPDGTPLLKAMKEKEIEVDGFSLTSATMLKMEAAILYLLEHSEASNFIFIEDGEILSDNQKRMVIEKYPEFKEVVEMMDQSMHINTSKYIMMFGKSVGCPVGLNDKFAQQAVEQLQKQEQQIIKNISKDGVEITH